MTSKALNVVIEFYTGKIHELQEEKKIELNDKRIFVLDNLINFYTHKLDDLKKMEN